MTKASELESFVGSEVRMVAEFDGRHEDHHFLHFGGEKIYIGYSARFIDNTARPGSKSPQHGQMITLVGYLTHLHSNFTDARYTISDPRWEF